MDKPIKDWVIKVQEQVSIEMDTRRKMASDIHELVIALEDIIETLTQGDPRWAKIACIKDAKYTLQRIRGY